MKVSREHESDSMSDDEILSSVQREAFQYFLGGNDGPIPCLIPDTSEANSDCSIAAIGFNLAALTVGVERALIDREVAAERARETLRFFSESEQSDAPGATGFRGFYYHFLDRRTGRRAGGCELSSIDTTLFIAGALAASAYFDQENRVERDIRRLAQTLYERIEWDWMCAGGVAVSQGWKPARGFLRYRWQGYNEGMLLYILALGSPTHPLRADSYSEWMRTYRWRHLYGHPFLYAGPLFIHQYPHCFIDFRGIRDPFMREKGSDYFENSRRAVLIQREYAIRNPKGFAGYGENFWGFSASDGPGPTRRTVDGHALTFYNYRARGAPFGPDDGSIAPCAAIAMYPFAPETILPLIRNLVRIGFCETESEGFGKTINLTFPNGTGKREERGWISPRVYGINQGPIVILLENARTDLIWGLLRACPYVISGLRRAGFGGGWLE